jgi:hypothetical protein
MMGCLRVLPQNDENLKKQEIVTVCYKRGCEVKIKTAGDENRTHMTSLEGRSQLSISIQKDHLKAFYAGVNWNKTVIRQEVDTGSNCE